MNCATQTSPEHSLSIYPTPYKKTCYCPQCIKKLKYKSGRWSKPGAQSADNQHGPLWLWRSIVDDRRGTLNKKMETQKRRVSDRHDGYAGRTVESMIVHHRCPLEDPYKMWETFRNRVSDNQHGCAGRTVESMTVRRMCPLVTVLEWSSVEFPGDVPANLKPISRDCYHY